MRSKTSCFNMHLARHMTLRYWPLWALYALVIFVMGPVTLLGQLNDLHRYSSELYIHRSLVENATLLGPIFNGIATACAALAVFSPLYKTDSAVMEAALPVERKTRFVTSYITGLSWLIIADVVMFAIMAALEAAFSRVYMAPLVTWLGVMVLQNAAFYAMAVFGAMLTGRLIIGAGIIAFIHFGASILCVMVYALLDVMLWGYAGQDAMTDFMVSLSPIVQLFEYDVRFLAADGTPFDMSQAKIATRAVLVYNGWGYLVACLIAGVVLAAIAYALYKRRHMETAGETISVKFLRPVFIAAATAYCAMGIGIILYDLIFTGSPEDGSAFACAAVGGCMLVGAFVGYVLGMMILKRSIRVWKSLKGFVIPAGAVVLFAILCATGMFGWSTWLPDADDVQFAEVSVGGYRNTLYAEEDVAQLINIHSEHLEQYDEDYDGRNYRYVTYSYTMDSGTTVYRYFKLPDWVNGDDAAYLMEQLLNDSRLVLEREIPGEPKNMLANYGYFRANLYYVNEEGYTRSEQVISEPVTSNDVWRLINEGIIPDIRSGCNIGLADFERGALIEGNVEYAEKYGVTIEIAENSYARHTREEIEAVSSAGTPVELNENIHISLELCYYVDADDRESVYFGIDDSCVNTMTLLREMGYIK